MQDFGITDRTIATLLADGAARLGQKPFLLYEDRRFGWAEAEAISNRLAHGLRAWGVVRGEHVAVLMDNRPEQVWLFFALMKLGAVVVPVNTAARGELLVYYLRQSRARALVVEAEFAGRFAQVRDQCGEIERLALLDETDELAGTAYAELLADDASPISAGGAFNDLALLSYTSGTTGPSKGNMATQAHMLGCGHDVARIFGYGADDVLYTCLPVFHGNAWLAGVLPTLWADATLAVSRRFSASNFWSEARRHGATQFNALGAMINIIWSQPERADDADNPVRQCMVVPTPKEFYHAFEKRFDLTLTTVYALTDFGFATLKPADAPAEKWASAGRFGPPASFASSTTRISNCRRARSARSSCDPATPGSSRSAISTWARRRSPPGAISGSTPATAAGSIPTAGSTSPTARRTRSAGGARTSPPTRSSRSS